jgi:hypothetical protein
VFAVKYELGFYIPEDGILHSHCREYQRSYNTNLVSLLNLLLAQLPTYPVLLIEVTSWG